MDGKFEEQASCGKGATEYDRNEHEERGLERLGFVGAFE